MRGEHAVLIQQPLLQRHVVGDAGAAAQAEAGQCAGQGRVRRGQHFQVRHLPRGHRPTLAQVTQACLLVGRADALVQGNGFGQRQVRGEIDRAGVHAAAHAPIIGLAHVRVEVGHAALAHVHRAHAHRRADPLVQVDAHEIGLQVRHREGDLAEAVGGIDDHIDAARTRAFGNLGHRQHQAVAVADLGQQHQLQLRQPREGGIVGLQDLRAIGHRRQGDALHLHAAPLLQPVHGADHAVVVHVGVQHLVARREAVVAADEGQHRLGGTAGQGNLVDAHAQHVGHLAVHGHVPGGERVAPVPGVAAVHLGGVPLVAGQGLATHRAPVAVFQMVHFIGDVEVAGHGGPVAFIAGQHVRRHGRCRNFHGRRVARPHDRAR